jgi:hypothetical protein
VATNKPVGDNARKGAAESSLQSDETAVGCNRGRAAREVGTTKSGMEGCGTGLQEDALVTLIDTNQRLREKAVALMLEIAILRER